MESEAKTLPSSSRSKLVVAPKFSGERHDTTLRGTIIGIDHSNMNQLGVFVLSLVRGIVRSLVDMLPAGSLAGRRRVVASGNAIRHSQLFRRVIEAEFGLPLVILSEHIEEAAVGAAKLASNAI
jgi:sugar (pentulose or hexulose) kinase